MQIAAKERLCIAELSEGNARHRSEQSGKGYASQRFAWNAPKRAAEIAALKTYTGGTNVYL